MGIALSIYCMPGKRKATWEVVPREVETPAKVCTAKKHLSVAQNTSHVTLLGVVTGVSVCIEGQRTTFRFSPSAECFSDQNQAYMARI